MAALLHLLYEPWVEGMTCRVESVALLEKGQEERRKRGKKIISREEERKWKKLSSEEERRSKWLLPQQWHSQTCGAKDQDAGCSQKAMPWYRFQLQASKDCKKPQKIKQKTYISCLFIFICLFIFRFRFMYSLFKDLNILQYK